MGKLGDTYQCVSEQNGALIGELTISGVSKGVGNILWEGRRGSVAGSL